MKTYVLAMFLGLLGITSAGSAGAATGEEVCATLTFQSDRENCLALINNQYVDDLAADLCLHLSFRSNAVDCLRAGLNKIYNEGQMAICRDSSFDSGKIQCLSRTGTSARADIPSRRRLQSAGELARRAIIRLDYDDVARARELLERIEALAAQP